MVNKDYTHILAARDSKNVTGAWLLQTADRGYTQSRSGVWHRRWKTISRV